MVDMQAEEPMEATLFLRPGRDDFKLGLLPVIWHDGVRFELTLFPFVGEASNIRCLSGSTMESRGDECGMYSELASFEIERAVASVGAACFLELVVSFHSTDHEDAGSQLGVDLSEGVRLEGAARLTVVTCADERWARSWANLGKGWSRDGSGRLVRTGEVWGTRD